jgi:hypothetical protein
MWGDVRCNMWWLYLSLIIAFFVIGAMSMMMMMAMMEQSDGFVSERSLLLFFFGRAREGRGKKNGVHVWLACRPG